MVMEPSPKKRRNELLSETQNDDEYTILLVNQNGHVDKEEITYQVNGRLEPPGGRLVNFLGHMLARLRILVQNYQLYYKVSSSYACDKNNGIFRIFED